MRRALKWNEELGGPWRPVARYLHTPGDDCSRPGRCWWSSSAVMRRTLRARWVHIKYCTIQTSTHPSQIVTATLTTICRALVWLPELCVFCPYTAAVASIFFFCLFVSWTSRWRLARMHSVPTWSRRNWIQTVYAAVQRNQSHRLEREGGNAIRKHT